LVLAPIVLACSGDGGDGQTSPQTATAVAVVNVVVSRTSLAIGETATASASGLDQNGRPVTLSDLRWSSTNAGVLTVSASGLVTGLSVGSAEVVAVAGGRQGSAAVTVTAPAPVTCRLDLVVSGLPNAVSANVTVTGPGGFSQILIGSRSFASLSPGEYVVAATKVSDGTFAYNPAPEIQNLNIGAGATLQAIVAYNKQVPSLVISPSTAAKFVGDTLLLKATLVDAQGAAIATGTTAWSSDAPSVLSFDSPGVAHAHAVGSANVTATAQGVSSTTRITVTPSPNALSSLDEHYPFRRTTGPISVYSDIGQVFADSEAANLSRTWTYFTQFFGSTAGPSFRAYYTLDSSLYVKTFLFCPGNAWYPQSRQTSSCFGGGAWSEYYVPMALPDYQTQLHEVSHLFLYGLHPDAENFPWLKEGLGMYFESGSFNAQGAFVDTLPLPYLRSGIRAYRNALIPLDTVMRLSRDRFYGAVETGDVAFTVKTYSESGMFVSYMMRLYPAVLNDLVASFKSGLNRTNDQVIQFIVNRTGQSINQLESAYLSYAAGLPP